MVLEKMENNSSITMIIVLLFCIPALPLSHSSCIDEGEKLVEEIPRMAAVPLADGGGVRESSPEEVEEWFQDLPWDAKPKLTQLHFYVHDNVTAKNPTAVLVAPAGTRPASTVFGATYVMDDPITITPDPSSKIIGRAQGVFSFVSQADPVLSMAVIMTFTGGKYNGSTLSILGSNPITHAFREMPILGGSGVFRLARGTATINTVIVDLAKLNDILEYHVVVQHY